MTDQPAGSATSDRAEPWLSDWVGADTIADPFGDTLASLGGGALPVWWATRGWGTMRRIPGRRRDTRDDAGAAPGGERSSR